MYTTEDSFFVTLLSDTSQHLFKNNSPANFTNKLAKRLEFSEDMEVGLLEIHYPQTLCNTYSDRSMAWVRMANSVKERCVLERDYVTDVAPVLKKLEEDFKEYYTFEMLDNCFSCLPLEDLPDDVAIRFSKVLAMQLGFPTGTEFTGPEIIAPTNPDFNIGLPANAFVYCNIVKPQIVGDKMCELLRTITINTKAYRHGCHASMTFAHPQYLPVSIKEIDEISIDIRDQQEHSLPFISGSSSVLLHFRRRSD
jgi:hypothetical protein